MTDFFYLLASLPELYADKAPPISHDQFLIRCGQELNPHQMALLARCRYEGFRFEGDSGFPPALARWMDFEHSLRLVTARSLARKNDLVTELPATGLTDSGALAAANRILQEDAPLERARAIMNVRWKFLSGLLEEKLFGLDAVCIYSLKLQLLEKAALWNQEAGERILADIIEKVDTGEYGRQN